MPIGQFYEIDVDNKVPFTVCGGLQDNGVWCVPSAVRDRNGIADRDGWNIGGGDGFYAKFDPRRELRLRRVAERQRRAREPDDARTNRRTSRWRTRWRQRGRRAGAPRRRRWFNWDTPIVRLALDPERRLHGRAACSSGRPIAARPGRRSAPTSRPASIATLTMMGARVPPTRCRGTTASTYGSLTIDRRIAARRARDLHRHRRRHGAGHARRRQDVDERHAKIQGLPPHVREHGAAVALRAGPRVRDVRRPLQRRLQAVRLRQRRLRPDVALDRGRTARDGDQPHSRASERSARARPRPRAGVHFSTTTAARGSRFRSRRTCRPCRWTTSSFSRATTRWWSARTGAASGFSTTSVRSSR